MSSNGERRAKILKVAKESVSYAEAGRKLGISREWVRQVVGSFVERQIVGYESLSRLAERYGYTTSFFTELAGSGIIPARKIAGKWYVAVGLELSFGSCALCGKSLGKGRSTYCSEVCAVKADRQSHTRSIWRKFHRLKGQKPGKALRLRRKESRRLLRVQGRTCVGEVK